MAADGALDAATRFLGDTLGVHARAADSFAGGLPGFATGDVAGAASLVDRTGFHECYFGLRVMLTC